MVIPDHYKTDAHCDTERDKQCVQHADRTGNIVLVSNIADAIVNATPGTSGMMEPMIISLR